MPPEFAHYRVGAGAAVALADQDPADTGSYDDPDEARAELDHLVDQIADLQARLYAEDARSLLVVLQGIDAAGKDSSVKHVFSGTNPQGVRVYSFKEPSNEEAAHDFLWRTHRATPRRGHITIFNRSHYEDVLVPRVHRTVPRKVLRKRYDRINDFERLLTENGTLIVKFFLHISKGEQRRRLLERLDDPEKCWKFAEGDLAERALWDRYVVAYEKLLTRCSTSHAPWYVIPADHKWYRNLAVASVLVGALEGLDSRYPRPALPPARRRQLRAALAR